MVSFKVTTGHLAQSLKAAIKASRVPCILPAALPAPPHPGCPAATRLPSWAWHFQPGTAAVRCSFNTKIICLCSYHLVWRSFLSLPASTVPMAFGPSQPLYHCSAACLPSPVRSSLVSAVTLATNPVQGTRLISPWLLQNLQVSCISWTASGSRSDGHLSSAFSFASSALCFTNGPGILTTCPGCPALLEGDLGSPALLLCWPCSALCLGCREMPCMSRCAQGCSPGLRPQLPGASPGTRSPPWLGSLTVQR